MLRAPRMSALSKQLARMMQSIALPDDVFVGSVMSIPVDLVEEK